MDKEWLVSDAACKGCRYYGYIGIDGGTGGRCCDYTLYIGKLRDNPPSACKVKVEGRDKRKKGWTDDLYRPRSRDGRISKK